MRQAEQRFSASTSGEIPPPARLERFGAPTRAGNHAAAARLPPCEGFERRARCDEHGQPRLVAPARLPAHESYFALTVHRAQGPEYDEVAVVPEPVASWVATRDLLYTAVTHARRRVIVHGTRESIAAALKRRTERSSGLETHFSRRSATSRPSQPNRHGDSR